MPNTLQHIKKLIAPRLDIPFARDDANKYLPYFIALMIFLAAFFVAGGITVGSLLQDKRQDFSDWLTIQIPAKMETERWDNFNRVLVENENIEEFQQLSNEKITTLLSPWFGQNDSVFENLSIPYVIEVKIKDLKNFDYAGFKKTLKKDYPEITIDGHEQWIDHYLKFIHILQYGAYLIGLLVVIATTVIIIFTSKTALKLHQNAITLLHSVGAEDDYIARQFQFNAFLLGMRGGVVGVAIAATLFFAVGISINEINTALLPEFPITLIHLAVWFSLPPLTGLLALLVARKTVLAMLRKMA